MFIPGMVFLYSQNKYIISVKHSDWVLNWCTRLDKGATMLIPGKLNEFIYLINIAYPHNTGTGVLNWRPINEKGVILGILRLYIRNEYNTPI